ncbi:MAG TPA: alpha/beta fold hydrolase, partial [Nocardioidaceae bacterium]|nr:alpha/beta fold hydrolase [Nocardioidaceae bacterium]
MRFRQLWPALVLGLLALAACAPAASQPVSPAGVATRLGPHNDTSTPFKLVSLPALIEHRYDGRDLRLGQVIADELAFTRYRISYRSGDLSISGVMNVPNRPGRHPVLVLAHGYADPADYGVGSGLVREQAYLAASGYVVLHVDYRNHGDSDRESAGLVAAPLGYPEDLVNAVLALKAADLPFTDTARIGYFGRSMGGGVTLNALAARPGLVDAAVLYSPVSSSAVDNFERFVPREQHPDLRDRVYEAYGSPEANPRLWREAGSRSFLDRIDVPVQIHHGAADETCPLAWSEATARGLRSAGEDVELFAYPGEPHRFDESWPTLMRRTVSFFAEHL